MIKLNKDSSLGIFSAGLFIGAFDLNIDVGRAKL